MKTNPLVCSKCGGAMSWGEIRYAGSPLMAGNRLEFVIPGTRTSMNPLKAFNQGLSDEPSDQIHDFSKLAGCLCSTCGFLEFYLDPSKRPE